MTAASSPSFSAAGTGSPEHVSLLDDNTRPHALSLGEALQKAGIDILTDGPGRRGHKCLEMASGLYDDLACWPADRQTLVVAVGGGVIGDLAGFVAAT